MTDNVQFDNDFKTSSQFVRQPGFSQPQSSGMAGWLVKKGIIKDESQAGRVLLVFVFITILITIFVVYYYLL